MKQVRACERGFVVPTFSPLHDPETLRLVDQWHMTNALQAVGLPAHSLVSSRQLLIDSTNLTDPRGLDGLVNYIHLLQADNVLELSQIDRFH